MTTEMTAVSVMPLLALRPALSTEDLFARVVEASPTALVLAGQSGRIEMVNGQAERMFGYDRADLLGKPVELLVPTRLRRRHVDLRESFFADASPRMLGEGRSLFGLRKDGSEFASEVGLNPIDVGGVPMVLAAIIDVTARQQIEREKEQQRCELVRSNADLEDFAYAASHDLKAPLRAISHLAEWISEDLEAGTNPETLENLRLLKGRVARMQMLLDGLLNYARLGRADSLVETVDVAVLVEDIKELLAPALAFRVDCDGPMPVIRTHRLPIQLVLENLIGNGLQHHDRAEGHITISARQVDGLVEFRVSDDGPGIAPAFHQRIFVMFQTLASRDKLESSGIGLTIVKKNIEAHGGTIWVESAPPARGTSFVFTWKEST